MRLWERLFLMTGSRPGRPLLPAAGRRADAQAPIHQRPWRRPPRHDAAEPDWKVTSGFHQMRTTTETVRAPVAQRETQDWLEADGLDAGLGGGGLPRREERLDELTVPATRHRAISRAGAVLGVIRPLDRVRLARRSAQGAARYIDRPAGMHGEDAFRAETSAPTMPSIVRPGRDGRARCRRWSAAA